MLIKKPFVIVVLSCAIVLMLAACGSTASSATTGPNQVHMNDTNFVQSSITIKKGESITLVDDTSTPHIIANGTWDNGTAKPLSESNAPQVKDVQVDGGNSTTIGPFTTAGTFHLYCTIHADMNLTVIVH
jgi:plastocyanin